MQNPLDWSIYPIIWVWFSHIFLNPKIILDGTDKPKLGGAKKHNFPEG